MDKDIRVWLYDIVKAIEYIDSFLADRPKIYAEFVKDIRTKFAVERNIEIIGEAMSRILKKDSTIEITNARKIVDTRNNVIHGYDRISDEAIWGIVINHLPLLKTEVEKLLAEQNTQNNT